MSPEQLIAAGPVSQQEAAAGAEAVKAAAAPEHKVSDNTKTSNVLGAFEAVKNQEKGSQVDEAHIKALLKEEEKADDSEDSGEEVSGGDEGVEKEVQASKKEVAPAKQEPAPKVEEERKLPPTAKVKPIVDEDLKSLVPESALGLFKKMDNSARQWVVAELKRGAKEREELKSKLSVAEKKGSNNLPENWFEHEEAYTLSPEYKQIQIQQNRISAIEKHYREQLIAIKEGEDWFDLVQNKDGSISQVKQKASPQADALVMTRLNDASAFLRELEKQDGAFRQAFKTSVVNNRAGVKQLEDEYFPQYADDTEFSNNEDAKSIKTQLQSLGVHNDRLAGVLTKLYAFAMEQVREVENLKKATEVSKKIVTPKNGPTGDEINKGSSKPLSPDERPFNLAAWDSYTKN